jgi:hypothetical protein
MNATVRRQIQDAAWGNPWDRAEAMGSAQFRQVDSRTRVGLSLNA